MNLDPADAKDFIQELRPLAAQAKWCDVVLCVPFLHIPAAVKAAK
ncbi:MAG: triose-phosphate isomerase, partial [Clostridia bacterium]|nr:triose-phosphate isomerase [Clostridia bacterium]